MVSNACQIKQVLHILKKIYMFYLLFTNKDSKMLGPKYKISLFDNSWTNLIGIIYSPFVQNTSLAAVTSNNSELAFIGSRLFIVKNSSIICI